MQSQCGSPLKRLSNDWFIRPDLVMNRCVIGEAFRDLIS